MNHSLKKIAVLCISTAFLSTLSAQSNDKRRDVLRYGLENEIVELVTELRDKEDTTYNADLESLFSRTRSVAVRESILSMYAALENPAFSSFALEVLADPWDYRNSTVSAVFSYVQKIKPPEASPLVRTILDNESEEFRDQAIRTLGKIGTADDAAYLVDYLQGTIEGDERQRLIIRQNVMEALGELKSDAVWDDFVSIAQNEDENIMIRATAVRAIGSIGREGGDDLLAGLFETDDPLLRSAAVSGLSGYSGQVVVDVVLEALKDTHYRVRLEALNAVEKLKIADAARQVYNINADAAAAGLAEKLQARKLVFLSDVPGLLADPKDRASLMSTLRLSEVEDLIARGVIGGGMLPKISGALKALKAGVRKTHIIDAALPHSLLLELFTDQGVGTEIVNDAT